EAPEDVAACGQPCMPAAFMVLHAAAICGVHLAAAAAVQVDDLDEAAAAEALSSHANVSDAHVPSARTADAAKTSRECFITHLQAGSGTRGGHRRRSIGPLHREPVIGSPEECY